MLDRFPSRGERHAGGDDPTPCADPKGTEVRDRPSMVQSTPHNRLAAIIRFPGVYWRLISIEFVSVLHEFQRREEARTWA
jgi:hypothetical protein